MSKRFRPLRASAVLSAVAVLLVLAGCGNSALVQCRINAVEHAIPEDPEALSIGALIGVQHQLHLCNVQASAATGGTGGSTQ
jgi:hypothetical protein